MIFYQSQYQGWHFGTAVDWAVYELPIGTQFQTINAPIMGASTKYIRTLLEVAMAYDHVAKKEIRMYISRYSKNFETLEDALIDDYVVYHAKQAQADVS